MKNENCATAFGSKALVLETLHTKHNKASYFYAGYFAFQLHNKGNTCMYEIPLTKRVDKNHEN